MSGDGGMVYIGTITKVGTTKIHVEIPALGGDHAFGPLNIVVPILIQPVVTSSSTSLSTTTGSASVGDHGDHSHSVSIGGHTHTTNVGDALADYFQKGDRVVVAQVGHVTEDLVVLGKLM